MELKTMSNEGCVLMKRIQNWLLCPKLFSPCIWFGSFRHPKVVFEIIFVHQVHITFRRNYNHPGESTLNSGKITLHPGKSTSRWNFNYPCRSTLHPGKIFNYPGKSTLHPGKITTIKARVHCMQAKLEESTRAKITSRWNYNYTGKSTLRPEKNSTIQPIVHYIQAKLQLSRQ